MVLIQFPRKVKGTKLEAVYKDSFAYGGREWWRDIIMNSARAIGKNFWVYTNIFLIIVLAIYVFI